LEAPRVSPGSDVEGELCSFVLAFFEEDPRVIDVIGVEAREAVEVPVPLGEEVELGLFQEVADLDELLNGLVDCHRHRAVLEGREVRSRVHSDVDTTRFYGNHLGLYRVRFAPELESVEEDCHCWDLLFDQPRCILEFDENVAFQQFHVPIV
jgi:hypothetical protein